MNYPKMNKKADSKAILIIVRLIFISIVLVTFYIFVRMAISRDINTEELEANVIITRLLYQPDGIIYYDDNLNRYYPGVIDLAKFNEARINNSLFMENNSYYTFNMTLYDKDMKLVKSIMFNPEKFGIFKNAYDAAPAEGAKVVRSANEFFYDIRKIQYLKDDEIKSGYLRVEMYLAKK